mgnify:CR=1 FL=1
MALDSYTNLITEVGDLLNRGDLVAKVPTWIALVEAELRRELQGRNMRTEIAITFGTTGVIALPLDMGRPVSLTLETALYRWPVELTTYERVQIKRGQIVVGPPRYACVIGAELRFPPTDSDTAYTGTLIYDADIPALTTTNLSNWVLVSHPDVYLYGAALHSAPYLRDDERIQMWKEMFYQPAIAQVRLARDRAEFGANTPVIRPKSALGGT